MLISTAGNENVGSPLGIFPKTEIPIPWRLNKKLAITVPATAINAPGILCEIRRVPTIVDTTIIDSISVGILIWNK